jgi:hypothetical protein
MNKRDAVDKTNRLLLVLEGLPDVEVIGISLETWGQISVQLFAATRLQFTTRQPIKGGKIRESVEIAGVEVFQLIDAPVPEGM